MEYFDRLNYICSLKKKSMFRDNVFPFNNSFHSFVNSSSSTKFARFTYFLQDRIAQDVLTPVAASLTT